MTMTITLFNAPMTLHRTLAVGFVLIMTICCTTMILHTMIALGWYEYRRSLKGFHQMGEFRWPIVYVLVACICYCIYSALVLAYFKGKH